MEPRSRLQSAEYQVCEPVHHVKFFAEKRYSALSKIFLHLTMYKVSKWIDVDKVREEHDKVTIMRSVQMGQS